MSILLRPRRYCGDWLTDGHTSLIDVGYLQCACLLRPRRNYCSDWWTDGYTMFIDKGVFVRVPVCYALVAIIAAIGEPMGTCVCFMFIVLTPCVREFQRGRTEVNLSSVCSRSSICSVLCIFPVYCVVFYF